MLKYGTALLVILAAVSMASAVAGVSYVENDLGGDLMQVTFYAESDDVDTAAFAMIMGFEGVNGAVVHQELFNGSQIDTEAFANIVFPAATKAQDSLALAPFTQTNPGTGPISGVDLGLADPNAGFHSEANSWEASIGTPGGQGVVSGTAFAQVVFDLSAATSPVYAHYVGDIARLGETFAVEGYIVPEPATMSLLGLGGIAALIRRRR